MKVEVYEKLVTGRDLNRIFNFDKLEEYENYFIHVENVDGSRNNYINNTRDKVMEVSDLYVSSGNMTELKMV